MFFLDLRISVDRYYFKYNFYLGRRVLTWCREIFPENSKKKGIMNYERSSENWDYLSENKPLNLNNILQNYEETSRVQSENL